MQHGEEGRDEVERVLGSDEPAALGPAGERASDAAGALRKVMPVKHPLTVGTDQATLPPAPGEQLRSGNERQRRAFHQAADMARRLKRRSPAKRLPIST